MKVTKGVKKYQIRVDKETQKISLMDTIRTVLECDSDVAVTTLNRHIFAKDGRGASIKSRLTRIKMNAHGNKTPVTDLNTLAEVIWMLPGGKSAAYRLKSAEKIGHVLQGDLTLFREKLMMPRPEEPVTRQSIVKKALGSVDISGGVRIDRASGEASMLDVIRLVLRCHSSSEASTTINRLFAQDDSVPSIRSRTTYIKINGGGQKTPVADLKTILEMIWKLPGKASARFRQKSAETLCRVMGGDLALVRDIQQNHLTWRSVDGGEVIQQALLKPIEYKEVEWPNRVKECSVRDALVVIVGGESEVETPAGFIDVLSDTDVIEVKYYKQWKHGLGQVLAYQSFYPRLGKRLHLFAHVGDVGTSDCFALAKSVCNVHDVEVTFEEVPALDDGTSSGGTETPCHVTSA